MSFVVHILVLVAVLAPALAIAAPGVPPGDAVPAWRYDLARRETRAVVIAPASAPAPRRGDDAGVDHVRAPPRDPGPVLRLWSSFPDGATILCSGSIVGPARVLTAGGCVHHPQRGGWATSVRVATSDGSGDAGASADGGALIALHAWTAAADPRFDVGVVVLDRPLGLTLGWRALAVADDATLAGTFRVAGLTRDGADDLVAHSVAGRFARIGEHVLAHRLALPPGMSGAPIRIGATSEVVAIQAGISSGSATRVTPLVAALAVAADDAVAPYAPRARTPVPGAHLKVLGVDDLELVPNPTVYPYSAVTKVWATFPSGERMACSGAMIGPSAVLTAAHCVHDDSRGGRATVIEVAPGYTNEVAPFGVRSAARVSVPAPWVEAAADDWDLAAIHLDDDRLGFTSGWLGVASDTPAALRAGMKTLVGFPGTRDGGRVMYRMSGPVEEVYDEQVTHHIDTHGGMSGGPIWRLDPDGQPYVVMVQAWSSREDDHNGATRVSDSKLALVRDWLAGGSVSPAPAERSDEPEAASAPGAFDLDGCGAADGGGSLVWCGIALALWLAWISWRSRGVRAIRRAGACRRALSCYARATRGVRAIRWTLPRVPGAPPRGR